MRNDTKSKNCTPLKFEAQNNDILESDFLKFLINLLNQSTFWYTKVNIYTDVFWYSEMYSLKQDGRSWYF